MIKKLLSARYFATVAVVMTLCAGFMQGKIDPKDFMALALLVVGFYFNRTDRYGERTNGA